METSIVQSLDPAIYYSTIKINIEINSYKYFNVSITILYEYESKSFNSKREGPVKKEHGTIEFPQLFWNESKVI